MKKNFVTKSSEKSKTQKVLTGLIAVFLSLTLFSGCFVLFKNLDFSTPEIQQEDPNKKDWEDFSVDHLEGKGTENSPWKISSAEDLAFLSSSMNQLKKINADTNKFAVTKALSGVSVETIAADTEVMALATSEQSQEENYYTFTSDIDLSNYRWNPIPALHGHLDGQGHTLNIGDRVFESKDVVHEEYWEYDEETNTKNLLLAPFVGQDTPTSNVTVTGSIIIAMQEDGTSVRAGGGNNPGIWEGTYCGGWVAKATNSPIVSVSSTVAIGYENDMVGIPDLFTGAIWLGGIVGWSDTYLRDCYYNSTITIGLSGFLGKANSAKAGGICGEMQDGFIADCANYGKIVHDALAEPGVNFTWTYYGGICGKYTGDYDGGRYYRDNADFSSFREREDAIVRCANFGNIEVNTFTGFGGIRGKAAKSNVNFCGGIVGGMWEEITWQTINACVNYGDILFHYNTIPGHVGMICGKFIGNFDGPGEWIQSAGGVRDCVNYGDYYRGDSNGDVKSIKWEGMIVGSISVGYDWFWMGWWQPLSGDHYIQYFSAQNYGRAYLNTDYGAGTKNVRSDFRDANDTRNSFRMFGDCGQKVSDNNSRTDIGKWSNGAGKGYFSQYEVTKGENRSQDLEFLISENVSVVNNSYIVCKEFKESIKSSPFVSTSKSFVKNLVLAQFGKEHKLGQLIGNNTTIYFPITMIGATRIDVELEVKKNDGSKIVLEGIDCPFYSKDEQSGQVSANEIAYKKGLLYSFNTQPLTKYLNPEAADGSYSHDSYHISWNSHYGESNTPEGYFDAKNTDAYYDQQTKDYYWKSAEHRVSIVDAEYPGTENMAFIYAPVWYYPSEEGGTAAYGYKNFEKVEITSWNTVVLDGVSFQGSSLDYDTLMPVLRLKGQLLEREDTLNSVSFQKRTGNVVSNTSDGIAKAELQCKRKGDSLQRAPYDLLSYASRSDKYKYKENDLWFLHVTPKVGYAVTAVYLGGAGKEVCVYDGMNMSASGNANNVTAAYNEEVNNEGVPIVTNLHTNSLQNDFSRNLNLTRKWSDYGDALYGKNNVWLGDFAMTLFVPCDCNGIKLFESIRICYKQITYKTDFYGKNAPNSAFTGVNDDLDYYEPDLTHYDWEQALLPSGVLTPLASANSFGFSNNGYLAYIAYFHNGEFDRRSVTEFELVEGEAFNKMSSMPDYSNYGTITWSDLVGTFVTDITIDQIDLVFIKVPRKTTLTARWTYNEWNHLEEFLSGDYVGTAEFFTSPDNTSLSENCSVDINSSNISIKAVGHAGRTNAYDCFVYGTAVNYLREDDTIDLQKAVDDIYIANAISNPNDFFKTLTKSTLARDCLYEENYKKSNFDVQFELRTYTLRGDTIIVNGTGGNVRLAYYTSKNLSTPNAPTPEINTTVMSNANNPIEVYYNAPVILIAEDNEKSPNFAGYYVVVGGNEYLLSTNKEYNFFFEDVMALVSKLYDASSNKDDLHIRAKYGSKAGETEGSVGTQPSKEEGVWQIRNFAELLWVSNQVNSGERTFAGETIKLVSDIDMLNIGFTPIGKDDKNSFQGVFDGQFFHINNLFVANSMDARNCYGLFGYIKNATIKNLIIQSCNVAGAGNVGGLVGYAKNSIIRRVEIYGNTDTVNIGGEDVAFFDIYTNVVDHLIFFNSTGSSSGFPTSINTTMLDGGYKPSYREEKFDDGGGGHSGVVGGLVGTSEGVTMVGCSNRGGVNGGGLIGNSLSDTTIDQSFCTSADNLCGEGVATITNSYYGNDIAATYGMSLSGEGIWSSEATLSENSKVWTVMNGHLALKIFYWDA